MINLLEVDFEEKPFEADVSCAISLKRIADALEKLVAPPIVAEEWLISEEDMIKAFDASHVMFNKS